MLDSNFSEQISDGCHDSSYVQRGPAPGPMYCVMLYFQNDNIDHHFSILLSFSTFDQFPILPLLYDAIDSK